MKTALLIGMMALSSSVSASSTAQVSSIVSVYDADTFRVNIDGWTDIIGKNMPIRVNGVDAAEIRGKCKKEKILAKKAREFTRDFLASSSVVELKNIKRGKYFRLIADVYGDGALLSDALIQSGLARPYHGEKRQGWCG
ncbi:thermonuclease family protein [Marinomonas transparens]|uniref:Thermonuclease family protein n=1 Tax=Marinomonas transparens TaxID=2795388 RepID=A0A934N3U1_9GAMM|nr:thermonuclease family protein [Marinomonas transparens]MBJ7540037.1 thermonuclease family protein [Marinomonas transparens]